MQRDPMGGASLGYLQQGRCPFPCIGMGVMRDGFLSRDPFRLTEKQPDSMMLSLELTHRLLLLDLLTPS